MREERETKRASGRNITGGVESVGSRDLGSGQLGVQDLLQALDDAASRG